MTVYEMCQKYYPKLWDINRINTLKDAGKITTKEYQEITAKKEG